MPRHNSYRTHHTMEPGGGDWSSSQLIIGIAVAIVFGLTCFAAGYVIARYDNPMQPVAQNATPEGQPAAPTTPESAPVGEAPQPGATTTETGAAPAASNPAPPAAPNAAPAPAPAQPPARPSDTVQRTGLRPSTVSPLPEPGGPTPMVKTAVDLNKAAPPEVQPADPARPAPVPGITPPATAAAPTGGTVPSITPPSVTPPVTPPAPTKTEPAPTKVAEVEAPLESVTPPAARPAAEKAPEKAPTPPAKPVEPKPAPAEEAPTVSKGTFGIQVASFDGPRRSEQAKEVQNSVKANANQSANIVVTPDGTYHKVVITGFKTRDAAKAACEKLKSKPGMEGAWVVRLP